MNTLFLAINREGLMQSLNIFWKGMLAIAIVIVIVILVTVLLNRGYNAFRKQKEEREQKDEGKQDGNRT